MLRLLSNLHLSKLDSYLLSARGFMMKTWIIPLFNFLLLAMCGVTSARAATTLSGKVVDETGKPVVGIEVGQAWLWNIFDKDSFRTYGSVKTDANGLFTYRVEEPHYPLTLFAADAHGQRGAVVTITEHRRSYP